MKEVNLTIESNVAVSDSVFLMRLTGDCSSIKNPGEFINITLPGYFLKRPISVSSFAADHVDILYKVLGHGTKDMSTFKKGTVLNCLIGLGNGFDITKAKKPLLVGGGIGVAPLIGLAEEFNKKGIKPVVVFGGRTKADLVMVERLNELCDKVYLTTDMGDYGYHGNPVGFLKENNIDFDYYYSCGPSPMLKFLSLAFSNGCVSLEARMGCGFGACMGCSIETTKGPKRVCKEGPVFEASEVKW